MLIKLGFPGHFEVWGWFHWNFPISIEVLWFWHLTIIPSVYGKSLQKFCTCSDSTAVGACAKFYSDQLIIVWTRAKSISTDCELWTWNVSKTAPWVVIFMVFTWKLCQEAGIKHRQRGSVSISYSIRRRVARCGQGSISRYLDIKELISFWKLPDGSPTNCRAIARENA